jgi:short-subunit dehydrogenase
VTGASSGIGRAIARGLAAAGCHVVITARRGDRLEALATELREAHKVRVDCVALDLAEAGAPAKLVEAATAGGDVDVLVNSAAFGTFGAFADTPWEKQATLVRLDIDAVVELTHRFLARIRAAGRRAWILNVSSVLGFVPMPRYASYAASKAYVRSFSEALAAECAGTSISVTCVSAGGTDTEFFDVATQPVNWFFRALLMSPERFARIALRAMVARRRSVVAGFVNSLAAFSTRFLPRRLASWLLTVAFGWGRRG